MIDLNRARVIAIQFTDKTTPGLGCFASGDSFDKKRCLEEINHTVINGQITEDDAEQLQELFLFLNAQPLSQPQPLPLGHSDLHAMLQQAVSDLMDLQINIVGQIEVEKGVTDEDVARISDSIGSIVNGLVDLVGAPEEDDEMIAARIPDTESVAIASLNELYRDIGRHYLDGTTVGLDGIMRRIATVMAILSRKGL
jgi:hypothetical protein